jgi:hypothetical protein
MGRSSSRDHIHNVDGIVSFLDAIREPSGDVKVIDEIPVDKIPVDGVAVVTGRDVGCWTCE